MMPHTMRVQKESWYLESVARKYEEVRNLGVVKYPGGP